MEGILANRLDYMQRIWKLRYFWFSLVKNDLNNRYKHSYLGIGWSLLRPIAMTAILCLVFGKLLDVPAAVFAPYLLIGMTTWQFITESMLGGCYSFSKSSAYIRQQRVPLAIFPLRTVLASGFQSLIALVLAIIISVGFRAFADIPPVTGDLSPQVAYEPFAILFVIPAIVLLFILGWFLAIISGVIYTHFPDTVHLLEIGLQILFYVTPILWGADTGGALTNRADPTSASATAQVQGAGAGGALANRARLSTVVACNPLASVLALIRTPVLKGAAPEVSEVLISLAFVAVLGVISVYLLRKTEKTLIFWI